MLQQVKKEITCCPDRGQSAEQVLLFLVYLMLTLLYLSKILNVFVPVVVTFTHATLQGPLF